MQPFPADVIVSVGSRPQFPRRREEVSTPPLQLAATEGSVLVMELPGDWGVLELPGAEVFSC